MNQVRSTGAALGTGPGAVLARENKALYDYGVKSQEIDQYLQKLGVDVNQNAMNTMLNASNQMAQGPDSVVVPGQAYNIPGQQSGLSQLGNSMFGMLGSAMGSPAGSAGASMFSGSPFSSIMNMFGGGQGQAAPMSSSIGSSYDYSNPWSSMGRLPGDLSSSDMGLGGFGLDPSQGYSSQISGAMTGQGSPYGSPSDYYGLSGSRVPSYANQSYAYQPNYAYGSGSATPYLYMDYNREVRP
jgi:hypothetical protein